MKIFKLKNYDVIERLLIIIILSITIVSCNSDDINSDDINNSEMIVQTVEKNNGYKITEEEAIENLLKFMNGMDRFSECEISLRSKSVRKVMNIELLGKNDGVTTYSSVNENKSLSLNNILTTVNEDSLLYLINFEDSAGYAIVSADERSNIIYAIVDEGSLDANSAVNNPGFIMYMENAVENEIGKIETYNNEILSKGLRSTSLPFYIKEVTSPKLRTKWGQERPYNAYCPNGYTGCVMTATAQILSHFQTFSGANYHDNYYNVNRSFSLNWNTIISDCINAVPYGRLSENNQSSLQVASLMRYLGIEFGATYYTDGSGTDAVSATAVNWLGQSSRGLVSTSFEAFDKRDAFIELKYGSLVYMKARRRTDSGGTAGHAWVLDGGMYGQVTGIVYDPESNTSTSTTYHYYYLHCNWGWDGKCDGYYYNGFNVAGGPSYMDDIDISSSSDKNYDLQQEMSIIHKLWQ